MPNPMFRASLTLMIGGALWGLLWIPLRAIEAVGVEGAWATLVLFVAPSLVLLPLSNSLGPFWRSRCFAEFRSRFMECHCCSRR